MTSPEYECLSIEAAAVLNALRLWPTGNRVGIFAVFREELAHYSKVPLEKVQDSLRELEREKWLVMDGRWVWIRNFLKFDPNYAKTNGKARAGVIAILNGLPRMSLVHQFLSYYSGLGYLAADTVLDAHPDTPSIPLRSRIEAPSIPVAVAVAVTPTVTKPTETETETETDCSPSASPAPVSLAKIERAVSEVRGSWATEACALWGQFLGTPPGGRIGHALKPLIKTHGPETVLPLWQAALEEAVLEPDPSYFTPEVFARTFVARLARSKAAEFGLPQSLVRVGVRAPPTPKEARRHEAMVAGVVGGLKGDGTYGGNR